LKAKNAFVFVVCGSREHIETLHFSLRYLKYYSRQPIWVLTDTSRNEIPLMHDQVVDVATPAELTHHQASIYLKTAIHRFLPSGPTYCYLDTDVIAIHEQCDAIFDEFLPPIRFAPDHCRIRSFSAYAVNCGCLNRCEKDRERFFNSLNRHERKVENESEYVRKKRGFIEDKYHRIQQSFLTKLFYAARYYLNYPRFWLSRDIYFDKKRKLWATAGGEIVKYELDVKSIAREANLKYTLWYNQWKNKKGENIFDTSCDHLREMIGQTFGVKVREKNWQHWNGGVFLFNEKSEEFLEAWHRKCMQTFALPEWKTRDQGTLIATVWEFGLQNQPLLSREWNFIADFHNNKLAVSRENDTLTDDLFKTTCQPRFIHVFHEWANPDWAVWQWIEDKMPAHELVE
jgi:hypothetical protein